MKESRQASFELIGTADHTGCGVQHSLQCVSRRFRRVRQDCVAVVNARRNERMYECGRRLCIKYYKYFKSACKTSNSAVAKRPRDASCLSVVSCNSTIPRAQFFFIISYFGFGFTSAYNSILFCCLLRNVEPCCHTSHDSRPP